MIEIKGYGKSYDKKKVIDNMDLTVGDGELFGFIGHNGAGKTTTIKSMVGILEFEQGDIFINGSSIRKDPIACKSQIAYIPDTPNLYDNLTGVAYLNFICNIFGISKEVRKQRIEEFATELELISNLGDSISSYSHGMKQKLAIIGALVHQPRIMVLDEPFVGLDPKASFLVKGLMRKLCDQGGIVFFSSHILEVVEKLCDRIAIIQRGAIVKHGKTSEVMGDQSLEQVFLEMVEHE
ncbi:MAG: ABC transporter ATP-binding protein [Erysipelotrichaceae bacterium]|jgi:ABC-2 type transport system ATP-binding protein|nr:ABC transporter ATP-binding protein [Erysipelotrichaceae bacterium]